MWRDVEFIEDWEALLARCILYLIAYNQIRVNKLATVMIMILIVPISYKYKF
jgi:hypothetical protein